MLGNPWIFIKLFLIKKAPLLSLRGSTLKHNKSLYFVKNSNYLLVPLCSL